MELTEDQKAKIELAKKLMEKRANRSTEVDTEKINGLAKKVLKRLNGGVEPKEKELSPEEQAKVDLAAKWLAKRNA